MVATLFRSDLWGYGVSFSLFHGRPCFVSPSFFYTSLALAAMLPRGRWQSRVTRSFACQEVDGKSVCLSVKRNFFFCLFVRFVFDSVSLCQCWCRDYRITPLFINFQIFQSFKFVFVSEYIYMSMLNVPDNFVLSLNPRTVTERLRISRFTSHIERNWKP